MVFPIGAVLGVVSAGVGIAGSLLSTKKRKLPPLPPPTKAKFIELQQYPPSPERDKALSDFVQIAQDTKPLFEASLAQIEPEVQLYFARNEQDIANLQSDAAFSRQLAAYNPYEDYLSNPAARLAERDALAQEQITQAYSPYGTEGSKFDNNISNIVSELSRRGIASSGVGNKAIADNALQRSAQQSEAFNKARLDNQNYLLNAGQLYNQSRGDQRAFQEQARAATDTANKYAQNRYATRQKATDDLGNYYLGFQRSGLQLEDAGRQEKFLVDSNNTAEQRSIDKINAQAENQFKLGQYNAEVGNTLATPTFGQALSGAAGVIGGLGNSLGSLSFGSGNSASCASGKCNNNYNLGYSKSQGYY